MPALDDLLLQATMTRYLDRWPSAGLAIAVVRDGSLAWFHGHGVADVAARSPVAEDTVFRIGSITKTMTAIAVMQLWEQGLVDLDAPANDHLRALQLVPARSSFRPATVRHLLTHTAGIGYWPRFSDLLRPGPGSGVQAGRSVPSLEDRHRRRLPVEVEPGTKWVYCNHGFAALGQIVEDVSDQPFARYLRDHVFDPLGMAHTDVVRSERVRPDLATGYVLGARGLRPVVDREVPAAAGGEVYTSARDMARYVAALLGGGSGEHGSVLKPETLASMFEPHVRFDPRVPGMGLGFHLDDETGHRTVGHSGVVSGFLSAMLLAPDDDLGVVVLANTGRLDARGAPELLAPALLRRLLGLPEASIRTDVPPRPESWGDVCGWYSPAPGPLTNLMPLRAIVGAGAEVVVRDGHLMLEPLSLVPAMRRGLRLHPDDEDDPDVFRVDFSDLGKPTLRVAFVRETGGRVTRLLMDGMSLQKRPDVRNPRPWAKAVMAAGAAALAMRQARRATRVMAGDPAASSPTRP